MAIVRCPTCGARLELEDQYLGHEVDCGDCRAVFVARAENAPPPPVPSFPPAGDDRPARRRRDDDDYDDEDDYDRPRRRSRRGRNEDDLAEGSARVKPPAVCLIVASTIGLLVRIADLAFLLLVGGGMFAPPGGAQPDPAFQAGATAGAALAFVLTPIALVGSIQMFRVKGYTFAMTTAILSVIPCTGCCVLNVPFGIWAIVVLCDEQVKRAFELNARY